MEFLKTVLDCTKFILEGQTQTGLAKIGFDTAEASEHWHYGSQTIQGTSWALIQASSWRKGSLSSFGNLPCVSLFSSMYKHLSFSCPSHWSCPLFCASILSERLIVATFFSFSAELLGLSYNHYLTEPKPKQLAPSKHTFLSRILILQLPPHLVRDFLSNFSIFPHCSFDIPSIPTIPLSLNPVHLAL